MAAATRKDVPLPAPHPAEFRRRAVQLARENTKPIAELAKELNISESCLRNWIAQDDADNNGSDTQLTGKEKKELADLRRDKRRLEAENEILKLRGRPLRPGEHPPKLMYPLVRELADDEFDVAVACRVLNVSRSGYYDWLGRPASPRQQDNDLLVKVIEQVYKDSRGTYGSPRVHAELTMELGYEVNLKRVARLMREAGIQGLYRRRYRGCTVRDPAATPSADLVERNFTVSEPNRLWVTDITEHPTEEGKVYSAAVLDAFSRRIVGWSIADMRTELVTDALGHGDPAPIPVGNRSGKSDRGAFGSRFTIHELGVGQKDP